MNLPPIKPKPRLAQWLFDRDMSVRDGARYFDTTPETLRRAVLAFDDPQMRPPYSALMRRIIALTDGAITPDDFYPATAGLSDAVAA